jgi:uncharacterized membrane protein
MRKIILLTVIGLFLFIPTSLARDVISDWYIKDFYTEITVNKDSSLLITENIIADCGNLPDKHGIFRILPIKATTPEKTISTPVKLISITDFNGNSYKYSTIKDNDTIAWKIGDANKTVTGVNNYKITYKVENTIRFDNTEFDEFYWNVLGNFWEIEIENFRAKIIFPEEVNRNNTAISAYSGEFGGRIDDLTGYRWYTNNILEVFNAQILQPGQGITISATFPKNIFTPYKAKLNFVGLLQFILPILTLILCFLVWKKHGKDPRVKKTIVPEFEIPENISPMQMGSLALSGKFKNNFISATIVNLAVKGFISIEETKDKFLFFNVKDFKLKKLKSDEELKSTDKVGALVLWKLFGAKEELTLSSLKNTFYRDIPEIKKATKNDLIEKDLIGKNGSSLQGLFFAAGLIMIFSPLFLIFGVSGIIVLIFSFIMPKRTVKGAEMNWRIKGFKLYMETAEKYRQQFNEKENIFEKLLPYAMIFGITKQWTKKMEQIYGQDYFNNYHPIWFIGSSFASFNIDGFISNIESISRNISSSTGSSSGFGGGGFSGGGGGGGGGGGW